MRSGPACSSATPCSRSRSARCARRSATIRRRRSFIETAHRRGYRFIAASDDAEPPAPGRRPSAPPPLAPRPACSYAHSGNVNIAYQVVGDRADRSRLRDGVGLAPRVLLERAVVRALPRPAGVDGAADPVRQARHRPVRSRARSAQLPTLEQRLDDVRAVMEAVGSERAVLLGVSEGGPLCSLFAATYPERTEALIMIGSYARRMRDEDYPWGPTREERDAFCETIARRVGRPGRHRGARAVDGRAIPRSATGGRRTCAWAPAPAPPSR